MSQEQNATTKATRSRDLPQAEIFTPFTDNNKLRLGTSP